jgi:hypothetical protein
VLHRSAKSQIASCQSQHTSFPRPGVSAFDSRGSSPPHAAAANVIAKTADDLDIRLSSRRRPRCTPYTGRGDFIDEALAA